jgi:hypothetical protein
MKFLGLLLAKNATENALHAMIIQITVLNVVNIESEITVSAVRDITTME